MRQVVWNAIEVELPDDWELLQFSKDASYGRLAFADRYQFRFELDWTTISLPPDLERMASDYLSKLKEDGLEEPRKCIHLPWRGACGKEKDNLVSRYTNYYPGRGLLLEAIFLWPDQKKHSTSFEAKVLDSIAVAPYREDGLQHWKAYGLDFIVKEEHYLKQLVAEPGNTVFTFRSQNKREVETFARLGFLDSWLNIPVQDWIKSRIPENFTITSTNQQETSGHQVSLLSAKRSPTVLVDWIWGTRTFLAAAWICPKQEKLFLVTKLTPSNKKNKQPPISLTCCEDMEISL